MPWWPAAWIIAASAAAWWGWPASDDAVASAPVESVVAVPIPAVVPTPAVASRSIRPPAPLEAARSASLFKLVGTVKAANGADSFALVRRTSDSQLVKLRAGDRIEGFTVGKIESDSVVLAGVGHTVVVEADNTAEPAKYELPTTDYDECLACQ